MSALADQRLGERDELVVKGQDMGGLVLELALDGPVVHHVADSAAR